MFAHFIGSQMRKGNMEQRMHFGTNWSTFEKRTKVNRDFRASRIIQVKHREWSISKIRSADQETKKSTLGPKSQLKSIEPTWSTSRSNPKASHSNPSMSLPSTQGKPIWLVEVFWWWIQIQIQIWDKTFNTWNIICFLAFHPPFLPPYSPKSAFHNLYTHYHYILCAFAFSQPPHDI